MSKKRSKKNTYQFFRLMLFVSIIAVLFIVYLVGKVNLDVVLIKNDELAEKKVSIKKRIDELQVTLNKKRGYKRIVRLARKQGLIFISPSRISEIKVDLDSSIENSSKISKIFSKLAHRD
ncbi:MAG: hypothetical protein R6V04_14510 [bacterium]